MILLDTDVCIDYLHAQDPVASKLRAFLHAGTCAISIITWIELMQGTHKTSEKAKQLVQTFVQHPGLTIVPIDSAVAKTYISIACTAQVTGKTVAHFDLLIAATAICMRASLYTRNIKHFTTIPDLKLYRP